MGKAIVCEICGKEGKNGVNYILVVGEDEYKVHRPCGEKTQKHSPEGIGSCYVKFDKEALNERNVRAFWEEKFSDSKLHIA